MEKGTIFKLNSKSCQLNIVSYLQLEARLTNSYTNAGGGISTSGLW